jgi:hypothetical protein
MRDSAFNSDPGANHEIQAQEFAYPSWKFLPQLVAFAFCAALIVVAAIYGGGHGSAGARIGLCLVGIWGLLYAVRRMKSPWRIVVSRMNVTAGYWLGPDRNWNLDDLVIRAPSLGTFWESSVIVELRSGTEAFRLYRDLPGFERLCRLLSQ